MASEQSSSEVCLVLHFPNTTEIRTLKALPRRGQRIHSKGGDVWFVTEVLRSGSSTYTVLCVGSRDFLEDLRRRPSRYLASDLLSAARKAIRLRDLSDETAPERPRGLKWSDDWIENYLSSTAPNRLADEPTRRRSLIPERGDWFEKYLQRCRDAQEQAGATTTRHP